MRFVLDLVNERYVAEMGEFYPIVNGKRPWGYVWAVTLPCTNCGNRFPLTGRLALRNPKPATIGRRAKPADKGQSYRIVADTASGTFRAEVHDGRPATQPTLVKMAGKRGKTAVCCFCGHPHPLDTLKRMMRDGLKSDAVLAVADLDSEVGKRYRVPTAADLDALAELASNLEAEAPFGPNLQQFLARGLIWGFQHSLALPDTAIAVGAAFVTTGRPSGSCASPELLTTRVARCSPTEYLSTMPQH